MNSRTILVLVLVVAILSTVIAFKISEKSEGNIRIIRDIYCADVADKYRTLDIDIPGSGEKLPVIFSYTAARGPQAIKAIMPLKAYTSLKRVIYS